ncbi:MAG: bifunctional hydroxymethylpyrimidine kinase/phosphomethylpyrimidine kinase [Verrucomicrobia bacterium]|nr:bifunctional hydroxymethylpyrimidine kinase/phosphomethylpyrimidine kinase [Verrucomicrobiota bacterium]
MSIPRVLIIGGSDSSGGAGIQADLKTVSALGAFGMTVVTALTAQNTAQVSGILETPAEFVAQQIDACVLDIGCDAVKTGMLVSSPIVEAVAERIRQHQLGSVVVDPVMVSTTGTALLARDAVEQLKRLLLPLATVVTPNLDEAAALLGRPVRDLEQARDAARAIRDLGPQNVVLKGGHLEGDPVDVLFDGAQLVEFRMPRLAARNTHGTGCVFASAIAACLTRGSNVTSAVATAKEFVSAAIKGGLPLGKGRGPANPMAWPSTRDQQTRPRQGQ